MLMDSGEVRKGAHTHKHTSKSHTQATGQGVVAKARIEHNFHAFGGRAFENKSFGAETICGYAKCQRDGELPVGYVAVFQGCSDTRSGASFHYKHISRGGCKSLVAQ